MCASSGAQYRFCCEKNGQLGCFTQHCGNKPDAPCQGDSECNPGRTCASRRRRRKA